MRKFIGKSRSLEFLDHFTEERDSWAKLSERLVLDPDGAGGYIHHSDHSVPPEVSFQRYQQIIRWVHSYGACAEHALNHENHDS